MTMELMLQSAIVIAVMMFSVWGMSVPLRDVSIVDLVWGLGFVLVAWSAFLQAEQTQRDLLSPILISLWGIRLSVHLTWRNHGKPEDKRYQAMRARHGSRFPIVSLLSVFGLQGVVMWCVALPLMSAQETEPGPPILAIAGTIVFVVGFLFESVADWQLSRFKSAPANSGRVMNRGLWRFSRHPNYFGEILVWWGMFLVTLGAGAAWWTVLSPLLMTFLLMRVSGVTLLEKSLLKDKPEYAEYRASTNTLIPWFPRHRQR
ncbi:MAG TPA: DUF1295 domain-containing protein [Planctomycetaceae bacterium]|nr:DUF1295 domain-containing protein [Planctomycetaceae bacterium]